MGFNYYAKMLFFCRDEGSYGRHKNRVGYWQLEIKCTDRAVLKEMNEMNNDTHIIYAKSRIEISGHRHITVQTFNSLQLY